MENFQHDSCSRKLREISILTFTQEKLEDQQDKMIGMNSLYLVSLPSKIKINLITLSPILEIKNLLPKIYMRPENDQLSNDELVNICYSDI